MKTVTSRNSTKQQANTSSKHQFLPKTNQNEILSPRSSSD